MNLIVKMVAEFYWVLWWGIPCINKNTMFNVNSSFKKKGIFHAPEKLGSNCQL